MINGTSRSLILGSLLVCAAGFSACSDDDVTGQGSEGGGGAGPEGTGGKISGSGGKTSVGGGATTGNGGTTGVAGNTASSGGVVSTAGGGGTTGVGGGTVANGGAVTTAGTTGVAGGTVANGGVVSTAGAGGTTGVGGGVAGGGGTVSTAGSSSVAGAAGYTVSAAGAPQWSASGVAVLSVPLASVGQGQRFNYENADGKGVYYDLSGASLNLLACAPGAIGGDLHIFFTSFGRADSTTIDVPLSAITNGFTTISIPVPAASGSYDPAVMMLVRIEVEAGAAFGSSWQTPATVVYIDRIWASKGTCFNGVSALTTTPCDDNFTAAVAALVLGTSGVRPLTGTTLTWANQVNLTPAGTGGAGGAGGGGGGGQAGSSATGGTTGVAGNTSTAGSTSTAGNASVAGNAGTAGAG